MAKRRGGRLEQPDTAQREKSSGADMHRMWHARVERALKHRRDKSTYNNEHDWKRARKLERGQHWDSPDVGASAGEPSSERPRDRVKVNLVRAMVQDFLAFLVNKSPLFGGKPRRPGDVGRVKRKLAVLNYWWRENEMQVEYRAAVHDAVTVGTGILATGYTLELDLSETKSDGNINYEDYVVEDSPWLRRVAPEHFIIDPNARGGRFSSARWCAEYFFVSVRDLVANASYDKSLRDKIRTGVRSPETLKDFLSSDDAPKVADADERPSVELEETAVLFRVWDKKHRKLLIYAKGIEDEALLDEPWPYDYLDTFPYTVMKFSEDADEIYGVGLPIQLEDQQLELNRIRTAQFNHRRRMGVRKYAMPKEGLDQGEITKFETGSDGTIVLENIPGALRLIEQGSFPQDNLVAEQAVQDDIRRLAGQDELLAGGALPSRTTAAEVRARQSFIGLKVDDRVSQVDAFLTATARQLLQHIEANMTAAITLRIGGTGPDNYVWEKVSPEDVKAELDLDLESTSKEKIDPALERQQAMTVLQMTLGALPYLQAVGSTVNVDGLFRWVMGKFNDRELETFFGPPMPPPPPTGSSGSAPMAGVEGGDPAAQQGAAASVSPVSAALGGGLGSLSAGAQG